MKRKLILLLAFAIALAAGLKSYQSLTHAQPICGQTVECIDSEYLNSCIKTPTSLPAIDVHSSGD
ncbi:MAG TPA: hypothetical protein VGW12_06315 [Pyrinomonadaceae bacterium]|nr:hypothetical protein [Pyrinomonadaceae bacterium]